LGQEAFVSAWQWYADLIQRELVAPPPSAWDGLLGTHAALLEGRIAMALRSGWLVEALGRLPNRSRSEVRLAPLPSWGKLPRMVPVNAAYAAVAAASEVREDAQDLAVFVASDGRDPARDPGLPAWMPALDRYAAAQGVAAAELTETRAGWSRPALDHSRSFDVADVLMPAVSAVVAGGDAAAQHAARVAARLDELARSTGTG
jgi:ABC-type glycerol-3-phosphate transport system substrate-binding protein